ncbi:MAG TPA: pyridoxal phosphate-dependent aminotransferase [Saprospiraceae bacterium]|nr:pyridoxal phosphate-dependent aminotransferase [Saprospiraceae bacterium]
MDFSKNLSNRVSALEESATIKMAQMARDLIAQGKDIISLSLGEPDFDTPEFIKTAAKQALDDGYTKYSPVPGINELRNAISEKFKSENQLHYEKDQIVVSNGAKQCIANIAQALLNKGDEVVVFTPYWVSYDAIIRLAGGVPVFLKAGIEKDFKVDAEQLEKCLSDKTKFILFSSPCNPTGSVYNREELEALAAVILKHPQVMVVSDEIYEYINFQGDHLSIGALPEMIDRTITVNGMSKGFAMTGWRLGYMGAPKWLADACSKIQGQFTSGACSFGQKAAAVAIASDRDEINDMKDAFLRRRDLVLKLFGEIKGFRINKPEGAFYLLPDISYFFGKKYAGKTIKDANDFSEFILQEAHVAVVTGSAFGSEECIRLSYAAKDEELIQAAKRIAEAVEKLY